MHDVTKKTGEASRVTLQFRPPADVRVGAFSSTTPFREINGYKYTTFQNYVWIYMPRFSISETVYVRKRKRFKGK